MPIFNYDAISGYRQAQVQTEVAEENYRSQGSDLIDRLATAYLQVLLSDEGSRLAAVQVKSLESQFTQFAQRQERGEGTRVQVAQSQASLDVARARLLEAQDQADLSRRQLARLTGVPGGTMPPLAEDATPVRVFPDRMGDWLEMAVRQSPSLKARERNIEVARLGVRRQYAGHLPRLDLVSSLSRSESDTTNTIGQTQTLRSVGVQLSIPLFSGGGVDASVKQAEARREQAEEDSRNERESVEVDVQRHFQAIANGAQKIQAYKTAVESTALAWQGARRSLELGLGTVNEIADTQSAHFAARRDLVQARIDQLLSLVRLKIRAGVPFAEVTSELDGLITAGATTTPSPTQP
jgi:protease secretion system outer membrane protein